LHSKIAVKPLHIRTWLLFTAYRKSPGPYQRYYRRPATTYRLATSSALHVQDEAKKVDP